MVVVYYSSLWKPLFRLARALGLQTKGPEDNWIAPSDLSNLLTLAGFELVTSQARVLIPVWIPLVSDVVNRWLAPLPGFSAFAMLHVAVGRPLKPAWTEPPSVSVVVPARNEAGNIETLIQRLPRMGPDDELIFVEGHSTDGTWEAMQAAAARHPDRNVTCLRQSGKGKGDAVRTGFAAATRDVLMILDADLTVPRGLAQVLSRPHVWGVRVRQRDAPRVPHGIGSDELREHGRKQILCIGVFVPTGPAVQGYVVRYQGDRPGVYERLAAGRAYFGDFDPFGDFDLLFGVQRLGLKIVELPVRYRERTYGTTNIQRWRHGWLLLRMTLFAARRVKFL